MNEKEKMYQAPNIRVKVIAVSTALCTSPGTQQFSAEEGFEEENGGN